MGKQRVGRTGSVKVLKTLGRLLAIAGASLLVTSCAGLGGKELTTYDLTAPEDFPNVNGRSSAQILVPVPTALKSLDSEMIVVRPTTAEITYFGDSQWSDRLVLLEPEHAALPPGHIPEKTAVLHQAHLSGLWAGVHFTTAGEEKTYTISTIPSDKPPLVRNLV